MERRFLGFGIAAASLVVAIATASVSSTVRTPEKVIKEILETRVLGDSQPQAEKTLDSQFKKLKELAKFSPNSAQLASCTTFVFDQMVTSQASPSFVIQSVTDLRPMLDQMFCRRILLAYPVASVLKSTKSGEYKLTEEECHLLMRMVIESQVDQTETENLRAMIVGLARLNSGENWHEQILQEFKDSELDKSKLEVARSAIAITQPNGLRIDKYSSHVERYVLSQIETIDLIRTQHTPLNAAPALLRTANTD